MFFKVLNSFECFHVRIGSHILGQIEFNEVIMAIHEILTENDSKKFPSSFLSRYGRIFILFPVAGMLYRICEI